MSRRSATTREDNRLHEGLPPRRLPWRAVRVALLSGGLAAAAPVKAGSPVEFDSTDAAQKQLFEDAQRVAASNIRDWNGKQVLVEGGLWNGLWLETQPMGGEMYAKRDVAIARNNIETILSLQHPGGHLPAATSFDVKKKEPQPWYGSTGMLTITAPGMNVYHLLGKDRDFLIRLGHALELYDAWLWQHRYQIPNGCLETWCEVDTGEDSSERFGGLTRFSRDPDLRPNDPHWNAPVKSMCHMADSYGARSTLAEISEELGDGRAAEWRRKAGEVRAKLVEYLWRPEKAACYDRDRRGQFIECLCLANLRCMWHGVFTQDMADVFVARHLLNPEEFWTFMPLPSVARNDPAFRADGREEYAWAGHPMGLSYQRAIRALENYGHCAEVTLIGRRLLDRLAQTKGEFPIQFGADDGAYRGTHPGNYGPMVLACLEYFSRLHGIHVEREEVWWSGASNGSNATSYRQRLLGRQYRLDHRDGQLVATIDGVPCFSCSSGFRIVTDHAGAIKRAINIDTVPHDLKLTAGTMSLSMLEVLPNTVIAPDGQSEASILKRVPFAGVAERQKNKTDRQRVTVRPPPVESRRTSSDFLWRWLYQRDAEGARTEAFEKVGVPPRMFEFDRRHLHDLTACRTSRRGGNPDPLRRGRSVPRGEGRRGHPHGSGDQAGCRSCAVKRMCPPPAASGAAVTVVNRTKSRIAILRSSPAISR